jgi:uncharacterized protein (UPF0297 family)
VSEKRRYRVPDGSEGIVPVKKVFMEVHREMAEKGYHEINVHQERDV